MHELPTISGLDIIKALSYIGYEVDHQTGSHFILRQKNSPLEDLQFLTIK